MIFNLTYYAADNDTNTINYYFKQNIKININHQDNFGNTILHYAVIFNNIDLVKLYLKNKIDTNIQNSGYHTPLHLAVINHNYKIIKLLIKDNIYINFYNDMNTPLIHYLIYLNNPKNNKKIFKLFLKHNINLNLYYQPKFLKYMYALDYAISLYKNNKYKYYIIKLMLKNKAKTTAAKS